MAYNPHPTLGTASWNGNALLATTRQLNSTSAYAMGISNYTVSVSNYFQNEIDGLLLSTGGTTNQWAQFSSITDVNIANFNIYSTNTIFAKNLSTNAISTNLIYAGTILASALSTNFMSTNTLTAGNTTLRGTLNMCNNDITNVDFIGAVEAVINSLNVTTATITSLTGGTSGTNGTFADLTVNNNARFNNTVTDFTYKSISNVQNIYSGTGSVSGCNLNLYGCNALLGYGKNIEFDANQGSLVAAESVVTLKARNGNRG